MAHTLKFPRSDRSFEQRVADLRQAIAELPDREVGDAEYKTRCISYVVGNGFDAVQDGTKFSSRFVRRALDPRRKLVAR
ncbi:hypothetical protein [Phreatobacter cathodiphilus]|uniref:hypothetical protein n=1 Tax=Phreatobacter cathodiphilus TaxID=1868589 RepID=UPI0015E76D11|nr:hypothetical protein [Phreatobacter cathodiphilus]